MAQQLKEIYTTGNPAIDTILNRIGRRLDIVEGLNPDNVGFIEIESDKNIVTRNPAGSMATQDSDNVDITGGSIAGVTYTGSTTNTEITGGSIDGTPIGDTTPSTIKATKITITDSNGTVIHQLGETA